MLECGNRKQTHRFIVENLGDSSVTPQWNFTPQRVTVASSPVTFCVVASSLHTRELALKAEFA